MNAVAEQEHWTIALGLRPRELLSTLGQTLPWIKPQDRRFQRIYIASALSTLPVGVAETRLPSTVVCEYISNLSHMAELATNLRNLGYFPYVPGLDFLLGIRTGDWHEEDYRTVSMAFLEVCDAVLVGKHSKGVDAEVRRAIDLGIPVFSSITNLNRENNFLSGGRS